MIKMILMINGKPAAKGQELTAFDGEKMILKGWAEPKHPGSTGRVYVQCNGWDFEWEYYPSVVGGKFVEEKGEG
jgi:hypothetical protein